MSQRQQLFAIQYPARVLRQRQQQAIFSLGQRDRLLLRVIQFAARGIQPPAVKRQAAADARRLAGQRPAASQYRFHPGDHHPRAERFGDVIIGAHLQAHHYIRLTAQTRQHHHRQLRPRALQLLKHLQTMGIRQDHIQQNQRDVCPLRHPRQRVAAGLADQYFKRVRAKHIAEQFAHRYVVIHHQNDWFHLCLCPRGISVSLIDSASLRRQIPLPVTFFQAPSHLQRIDTSNLSTGFFSSAFRPKKPRIIKEYPQ